MITNLLLTAFRNLTKNKFFSVLNILGLAIGTTVFLLIAQYVKFERSYEDFIPGKDIYRLSLTAYRNNELIQSTAQNYPAVAPAIKNEIPEVINFARLFNMGYRNNVVITNENAKPERIAFRQRNFLAADSSFLSMMGYKMVKGNAATALHEPKTAVISEKYARLYFGNEDPMGKTLRMNDDDLNDELVTITGIFKDLPPNTHLKFDILFSYRTFFKTRFDQNWSRDAMFTYIQLRPGSDPKKVEAKFPAIINKYKPQLKASNEYQSFALQSLQDIHLHSDLAEEPEANGNASLVFFIGLIGLFSLVIAWINYINLSTARSVNRAKEVGVRKVTGASKYQLVRQFLIEAALINLLSIAIAWGLAILALPFFNTISGIPLTITYLIQSWFIGLLLILWIAGTILSGFYPAWVLSSFRPATVLKGKFRNSPKGILLRKGLVVTQFVASVALIAGTIIVYLQLDFMLNRNIGMNINQVMVLEHPSIAPGGRSPRAFNSAIDVLRNELGKSTDVQAVTTSLTIPGKPRMYKATIKNTASASDSLIVRVNSMDDHFLDVFKMKLLAGRNFSKDFPNEVDTSVVLTESTARLLGYNKPEDAIGNSVTVMDNRKEVKNIIGVVNDYHQVSLKKPLEPTVFSYSPYGNYYMVRIQSQNIDRAVKYVQKSWETAFPANPFEFTFLDEYFNRQYASEKKFGNLFITFAIFAILISCLGLFGLSAFVASQRIKEIGIRKVMGASVMNITTMLSKDFLKLVLIAVFISIPVAWFVMNKWMENFAYRINISPWIFVVAGLIALFIALITVSFQGIKVAVTNPVKNLRTE